MHGGDVFGQLGAVLVVVTIVSFIMWRLKQPLIMGYILTGIIVGPAFLNMIHEKQAFEAFSEIGIALLLFIIGLELSVSLVKRLGRPVILTALAVLGTTGTFGYLIANSFGFTTQEAIITGLALFFSSTIIIAKVLSDKKELTRLNGQIAIGVILVDDIVATFALLFVGASGTDSLGPADIGFLVIKGIGVILALVLLGNKVMPKLVKGMAQSQELLFIFALAWGFGVATAVKLVGFSVEVGALFAGVALAHLPYTHQIGARLKPLRDFFIILFFISLGESLQFSNLAAGLVPALVLSLVVLIVKPLSVMASLGLMRYTKRTSFKTAINLSQISEFSIILVVLANKAGMIGNDLTAIITLTALITIAISTYLMKFDNILFSKLENKLLLFERSITKEKEHSTKEYPLVMFGYKGGGYPFLKTFQEMQKRYVVVDYDPDVIDNLDRRHINYLYGDATDPELLAEINIEKIKLAVIMIGDHDVNSTLVKLLMDHNRDATIICVANNHDQAAELYELGATYVILPNLIGSEKVSSFLRKNGLNKQEFENHREKHLVEINNILSR